MHRDDPIHFARDIGARAVVALILGSLVTAGAVLFTRTRTAFVAAAGLAGSAAVGYILSRTTGLPNATGDIGNWTEPLGLASLFVEGAVVAAASTGRVSEALTGAMSTPPVRSTHPNDPSGSLDLAAAIGSGGRRRALQTLL